MLRRVVLALAILTATTVCSVGLSGCANCQVVYLNGPGNHPPGAAYIANIQTWTTVVGGQIHVYGYSLTIDTVIWNERDCIYNNLTDPRKTPGRVRVA